MENLLVISDMHGLSSFAIKAINKHPECKKVVFLGDGTRCMQRLIEEAPDREYTAVMGNCDTSLDGVRQSEYVIEAMGHRIFVCHGHTRNVKYGKGALIAAAKEQDADIALYGHTHIACEEYDSESGVYLFNPGSIGAPRDGRFTYGILSLDEKNVLFSIGEV